MAWLQRSLTDWTGWTQNIDGLHQKAGSGLESLTTGPLMLWVSDWRIEPVREGSVAGACTLGGCLMPRRA